MSMVSLPRFEAHPRSIYALMLALVELDFTLSEALGAIECRFDFAPDRPESEASDAD